MTERINRIAKIPSLLIFLVSLHFFLKGMTFPGLSFAFVLFTLPVPSGSFLTGVFEPFQASWACHPL